MRIKPIVPLLLLFFMPIANASDYVAAAGQFKSVIDVMAIKSSDSQIDWERVSHIKGVKWQWPHQEAGAHGHKMLGTIRVIGTKNQ